MIAPHELKNKVFNKAVRGYNSSEVDEYIEFILDQYKELYKENADLRNELHMTKVKYSELHNDEDSIRTVILKAQKLGETIVIQAKKEAESIVDSVKATCQEKIDDAQEKVNASKLEIEKNQEMARAYRDNLYSQYLEHIKLLKAMDFSFEMPADGELKEEINSDIDDKIVSAKENISSTNV